MPVQQSLLLQLCSLGFIISTALPGHHTMVPFGSTHHDVQGDYYQRLLHIMHWNTDSALWILLVFEFQTALCFMSKQEKFSLAIMCHIWTFENQNVVMKRIAITLMYSPLKISKLRLEESRTRLSLIYASSPFSTLIILCALSVHRARQANHLKVASPERETRNGYTYVVVTAWPKS